MKYRLLFLLLFALFCLNNSYSTNNTDTIKVVIDLRQVSSLGLKVNIYPPATLKGNTDYHFPKSVPGIYDYLKDIAGLVNLTQNGTNIPCKDNAFNVNCDLSQNTFNYHVKANVSKGDMISAEDLYFLKDSVYLLNWHYLIGFFNTNTSTPYKIEVIKNAKLFGTGTLSKKTLNDTIDIFQADNYKNLIHNPILYSIADTTSFQIGETKFTLSYSGDTSYNSNKIKDLLLLPLTEICNDSYFKHKSYSFLFFVDNSIDSPWLVGLEHPNSTVICYNSVIDETIVVSASVHEFIHSIYAPLRIRSEVIDNFDFINPKCDDLLWFYEGITEYFAKKTLVMSGYYTTDNFFNGLYMADKNHNNINFSKVSSNIYNPEEQEQFYNFYSKGSLFAFQLDVEIMKRSNNTSNLLKVMNELQKRYSPSKPFHSKDLIQEFSTLSGTDLNNYILRYVTKSTDVDFLKTARKIGYTRHKKDSAIWTYNPKKGSLVMDL